MISQQNLEEISLRFSMQLLVNLQIPRFFGGLEGKAIYIGMTTFL